MQSKSKIQGYAKIELIFILAFITAIAPLSTDMYLPALSSVQESFKTSEFLTQLSMASFFIAFSLGQLIYGPLSDIFGRKKPLIIGITFFMLASLGCVMVDNVTHFIALRFLEALGGCAGVVIARAIVNDLFEIHEASAIFALMMVVSSLAPMLSPTFGGFLLLYFSWQSIFITLFLLGILILFLVSFRLKESLDKKGNQTKPQVFKNYAFVLKDKVFVTYTLSLAICAGALFAYITGSSFVFVRFFELNEQFYALLFGTNALGLMLVSVLNAKLVLKRSPEQLLGFGYAGICAFGMLLLVAGFLEIFLLFEFALFFAIAMLGFVFPNITTLAMSRFKECSGTASAVLGTTQFAVAGLISFLVGFIGANTPILLALSVFLCLFGGSVIYFIAKKL